MASTSTDLQIPELRLTESEVDQACKYYIEQAKKLNPMQIRQYLIKTVLLMDLTSLNADDTQARIEKLCYRAMEPLDRDQLAGANISCDLYCAAVCTYPYHTAYAATRLRNQEKVKLAAVTAGFPSGQFRMESKVLETQLALQDGANEIDIVINRSAATSGEWSVVFDEIKQLKDVCGKVHMKTILATGELKSMDTIYMASWVAMVAGSDFIKTSTGKEAVNATPAAAFVMIHAMKDYLKKTGRKVGIKFAGGIRHVADVLPYLLMVEHELGADWLTPELCRIGASSLLDDVVKRLITVTTTKM